MARSHGLGDWGAYNVCFHIVTFQTRLGQAQNRHGFVLFKTFDTSQVHHACTFGNCWLELLTFGSHRSMFTLKVAVYMLLHHPNLLQATDGRHSRCNVESNLHFSNCTCMQVSDPKK